jgi:glycosyltransferase involved in cell wall biosynthesis
MLMIMKTPWRNLSVFFPVFNEAQALPEVIGRATAVLERLELDAYEIIIVDDGSIDESGHIADQLAARDSHISVVHHPENRGYGAALVSGFGAAQYEWVTFNDGDGQFDLSNLDRFFEPSTRVDVVLGYRRHRHDHFGRKLNAWLWTRLVWGILGLKVRDLDCAFKLFRTERVRNVGVLEARGAVISAELLLKLKMQGCTWEEVPVEHYSRLGGAPTGAKLRVIWRAIQELVRLRRKVSQAS